MKNNAEISILKSTDDCPVRDRINEYCSCPKTDCPRHGICYECILNHKNRENVKMIRLGLSCPRSERTRVYAMPANKPEAKPASAGSMV